MSRAKRMAPEELLTHLEWMRHLARALVRDPDQAEDLAQEGIEAALASPPLVDRSVRPWLAGVMRNLARMRLRAGGRRQAREVASMARLDLDLPPSPETLALEVETQRRLAAHVLALEEPFRSTLLLRFYQGQSAAQIARAGGVPAGTVRWRLKHGLDRVREALDQEHQGDRKRWRALLAPLVLRRPADHTTTAPALPLIGGIALMTTKTKLATGVGLLILLLSAVHFTGHGPGRGPGRDQRAAGSPAQRNFRAPRPPLRLVTGPAGARLAAGASAEPAGTWQLQGQVIGPDEHALEGATVAIDASPPRTASTDANGRFTFTALRARVYRLEAQAGKLYAGPVHARSAASGEPVVLRARPAAQIEIEVRAGKTATAVAGAQVELRSTLTWHAVTDAHGQATLSGVAPGLHLLRVTTPAFAPASQMVPVNVGALVQHLVVRLETGVAVSGKVVSRAGTALANARVWPRSSSEPYPVIDPALDAVTTDPAGRFIIAALAAGSYQIAASHPDCSPGATAPLVVAANPLTGIELRLDDGGRVVGHVHDHTGRPVPGAEVRAGALSRGLPWSDTRDAFTDQQGRFQITGLPRRGVQVIALHESGTSAMTDADLAGAGEVNLTLTLSVRDSIAGVVLDSQGQRVAEAQVSVTPVPPRSAQPTAWDLRGFPTMVSDPAGHFHFAGLAPGTYEVLAASPGADPSSTRNQTATKARAGDQDVKVVVKADGTVTGQVVFEDDSPADRFALVIGRMRAGPFVGTLGKFSVTSPAGQHDVTISGPGFLDKRMERIAVDEGRARDLGRIRIDRGRVLTGRVLAADGSPVAGAQVVGATQLTGSGTKLLIPHESEGDRETTTGEDGQFVLSGFKDRLVVVAEMAGRGRSKVVEVPRGVGPAKLDLVLQATGALEGSVTRDGSPFPDTVVVATQEIGLGNFFVTSGPDGRYALDILTAGPHYLTAFLGRNKDLVVVPVNVAAGKRTHADLDAPTGPLTLTVRVQTDEQRPVAVAEVHVISMALEIPEGESAETLSRWIRPSQPITVHTRMTRGPAAQVEGIRPGTYTVCAVAARIDAGDAQAVARARPDARDPLRCVTHPVSASREIAVTLPRSWTIPTR